MTPRDQAVLQALCEDAAEHGRGLTRADIEAVGMTRWPDAVLKRLREAGHRVSGVGSTEDDERFQLYDVERVTDQTGSKIARKDDQACAPRPVDGSLSAVPPERSGASDDGRSAAPSPVDSSSGAPPEGQLFPLPSTQHFDVRAAAA